MEKIKRKRRKRKGKTSKIPNVESNLKREKREC